MKTKFPSNWDYENTNTKMLKIALTTDSNFIGNYGNPLLLTAALMTIMEAQFLSHWDFRL